LIPFIEHRVLTHSIIIAFIAFIPLFAIYHKKAIPYFIALTQHSLIGDYITGQTQLLWPITTQSFGTGMNITDPKNVTIELLLFLASIIIMLKTKDLQALIKPQNSNLNLTLSIPTFTVLLPTFLSVPLHVPTWLILPHLTYISIFSASIIFHLRKVFKNT
jgi:membrane-bound metal-dependent hydrolase YbcI (DUF457 family)